MCWYQRNVFDVTQSFHKTLVTCQHVMLHLCHFYTVLCWEDERHIKRQIWLGHNKLMFLQFSFFLYGAYQRIVLKENRFRSTHKLAEKTIRESFHSKKKSVFGKRNNKLQVLHFKRWSVSLCWGYKELWCVTCAKRSKSL